MCGRVRLATEFSDVRVRLKFDPAFPAPNIPASWNVCPTDPMLVPILAEDGKRVPQQMRWGTHSVVGEGQQDRLFLDQCTCRDRRYDPCFRDAWKKGQRCLIITDGFYEWKKPDKQPYAVAMADDRHMVMAGLWDEWTDKKTGERIKSCTVITTPPNGVIGALHDRMPVILPEKHWAKWLGEEPATTAKLKAMLVPIDDDALKLWPVNRQKIGNVRNKEAEVALPEAV